MNNQFRHSQIPLVSYQSQNESIRPIQKIFSCNQVIESETIIIRQQIPDSFQQFWSVQKKQHQFIINQAKVHQKSYHEDKKKKLFLHLSLSLQKNQKQGIFFLLIQKFWIPYIHQRFLIQLTVLNQNWLDVLKTDFDDFMNIAIQLLKQYQYEPEIRAVQKTIPYYFFQKITTFPQWKQINQLMARIMQRKRNTLKKHYFTSAQFFQLSKSLIDFSFREQKMKLKDIYCVPSIAIKLQQVKALNQLIAKKYQLQNISKVLEYSLLLVGIHGFSEMFKYLLLFGQENQTTDFLQNLKVISDTLYSRDYTGFTNYKMVNQINQKAISKRAWKFVYDPSFHFKFIHHTKVFHQECTWQTIASWNQLNENCQIPFSVNIKNNFVKFGIVFPNFYDEKQEMKYLLCVSTGKFYKNKEVTKYQSFRKNSVTGLSLKVQNSKISWIVKDQQGEKQVVIVQMNKMDKVKVLLIFKKGEIQAFPKE